MQTSFEKFIEDQIYQISNLNTVKLFDGAHDIPVKEFHISIKAGPCGPGSKQKGKIWKLSLKRKT